LKTFLRLSKIPFIILIFSIVAGAIITQWLAVDHPEKLAALLYVTLPIALFTITIFIEMMIEGIGSWMERRRQKIRPE